jgi:polyisoprenyl-phosphate glycosyltransferase
MKLCESVICANMNNLITPTAREAIPRKLSMLSVVVPGLNEADNIQFLYEELKRCLGSSYWKLEILFIDDGSTDDTLIVCRELNAKDPSFHYLSLSRNFGHQNALTAGLDIVEGQAVVVIDADLQDPPAIVLEMISRWEQGVDVVYGQRRSRDGETFFKKATAKLFYKLLRSISDIKIPEDTGDFRLIDHRVVVELRKLRETGRFMRGLVMWTGFKQEAVMYDRCARRKGKTKYPLFRMIRFAWDGVTTFSAMPLRMATVAGTLFSLIAFSLVAYYIFRGVVFHDFIKGWASVMTAIFAVGGIQMLFIGLIGEYLAKAFEEIKGRPLYIIQETSYPRSP